MSEYIYCLINIRVKCIIWGVIISHLWRLSSSRESDVTRLCVIKDPQQCQSETAHLSSPGGFKLPPTHAHTHSPSSAK